MRCPCAIFASFDAADDGEEEGGGIPGREGVLLSGRDGIAAGDEEGAEGGGGQLPIAAEILRQLLDIDVGIAVEAG